MPRYPSAYRSESAREEAGHSRSVSRNEGFLAPGFVVEAPPGPPPGVVVAGAASGAAPSATALWGPVVAVAGGVAVGLAVREDIRWFERESDGRRPFYDGIGPWDRYDEAEWRGYPGYDAFADAQIKARHQALLDAARYQVQADFINPGDWYTAPGDVFPPGGWLHPDYFYCPASTPGAGSPPHYYSGFSASDMCGTNQAGSLYFNSVFPATSPVTFTGDDLIGHAIRSASFPTIRKTGQGTYHRGVGIPASDPADWVQGTPGESSARTILLPGLSGDELVATPWALAVATPYSQPPGDDYIRERDTVVVMPPAPFPAVLVHPSSVTITVPDTVIDVTPDGGVGVTNPPGRPADPDHPEPDPGKSRKHNVRTVGGRAWVALNLATEIHDTFEAAHEALPKHLRTRGRGVKVTPWQILEDIWNNFDEWDSDKFIENLVNNQIEDMVYGSIGRATTRGYGATFSSTGLTAISPDVSISIPEVSFEGGLWQVTSMHPTPHRVTGGS